MSLSAEDGSLPGPGDCRQGNKLPASAREGQSEGEEPGGCSSQQAEHISPLAPSSCGTLGGTRAEVKAVDASQFTGLVLGEKQEGVGGRRKMGRRTKTLMSEFLPSPHTFFTNRSGEAEVPWEQTPRRPRCWVELNCQEKGK